MSRLQALQAWQAAGVGDWWLGGDNKRADTQGGRLNDTAAAPSSVIRHIFPIRRSLHVVVANLNDNQEGHGSGPNAGLLYTPHSSSRNAPLL